MSAENLIRHRDQWLSVTDCIDNNVGKSQAIAWEVVPSWAQSVQVKRVMSVAHH